VDKWVVKWAEPGPEKKIIMPENNKMECKTWASEAALEALMMMTFSVEVLEEVVA